MKEFKTASLADRVFDQLENDIIMGVYAQGEILTELKLVEQLGVSRTPIREALRRLAQERLIEDTGKGSVVLGITRDDMIDIMDIRQYVEPMASYYAAKNITQKDLDELKHVVELQEFYCAKSDLEHLSQMDTEFHHIICIASGRNVIRDTLISLHHKTTRFRKAALTKEKRSVNMVKEHREIYDAIEAHDAEAAAQLTARHIEAAKKSMIERMNDNG